MAVVAEHQEAHQQAAVAAEAEGLLPEALLLRQQEGLVELHF